MQHTGGLAFSRFYTAKILQAARAAVPKLLRLTAHHVHFVDARAPLSATERNRLLQLLEYPSVDQEEFFHNSDAACQVIVIPRPGTISPWSSKATDIAHNCGIEKVRRIERGVLWTLLSKDMLSDAETEKIAGFLHDRMMETWRPNLHGIDNLLFHTSDARPLHHIPLLEGGRNIMTEVNKTLGLALSDEEIDYLVKRFKKMERNPTDVELMMFAQANSEHCRHKIFNANWIIDKQVQSTSLFNMIRNTHTRNPGKVLSAYHDNAAILGGFDGEDFVPLEESDVYAYVKGERPLIMKVETHNHPTAISPFPGAATGSGGEIRDEGASGRGSRAKAGLCGFSVSNLRIPGALREWEEIDYGKPGRIAGALEIMLEGPIGASAFNNEFGRPNLCGYFRSFEQTVNGERRGYHKPIMLAGGVGHIHASNMQKKPLPAGAKIIVLGGPAMLIGLGGGAASSMSSGHSSAELDFASVQRGNPEMQRRCQEVINACAKLGVHNPIYAIHDVGAGGLSNAVPELLHDGGRGGVIDLRAIPTADPALAPMEIWCNEAQERYVLGIAPDQVEYFEHLCKRERCPYAVIGEAVEERRLLLKDEARNDAPIDLPLELFLGRPVQMLRNVMRLKPKLDTLPEEVKDLDLVDAALRVLRHPSVAAKNFLITIGDRSVTGLVVRDQMVGPWQVPVADCAVTATGFSGITGEAMALGERTPLALIKAPASGRMAVAEALMNLAAAPVEDMSDIVLSANWMAPCGHPGEDAALFDTVKAVGMELCPALGIAIPVGKDSLSMKTLWTERHEEIVINKSVTAPLSLIASAFARVSDITRCLTPQLKRGVDDVLLLVDLGRGKNRMGGSMLAQVYGCFGDEAPDVDRAEDVKSFFKALQALNKAGKILAYHDRSDGGLFVTLCEMAFAGRCGVDIVLDKLGSKPLLSLFNEELGAVLQVRREDVDEVVMHFVGHTHLAGQVHVIGRSNDNEVMSFQYRRRVLMALPRVELHRAWAETTYHMQRLRDNPECAREEYDVILDETDPGLSLHCSFEMQPPALSGQTRPRLAVLREQGVNGQVEMAAAFDRAAFECVDVHMSDIIEGRVSLKDFHGLAACGGFSYGDVLGAGGGWAKSIRYNNRAFDEFSDFFQRADSFALGICNGCQMMAQLKDMIPGAEHWPRFVRNRSEQFEARLLMVEILDSPSILLQGMAGSRLPVVVAHGEGRAEFESGGGAQEALDAQQVNLRYVDNHGAPAQSYPANPNGSPLGITGLSNTDGRFTIMMPHPERIFLSNRYSWLPSSWKQEESPWMQLFWNARRWLS